MVRPESMMSSTTTTVRPSMFSFSPMSCFTFPVEPMPSYEATRTKVTSQGMSTEQGGSEDERAVEHTDEERMFVLQVVLDLPGNL